MHTQYSGGAITTSLNFQLSCRKNCFARFRECLENQIRLMFQFYSSRDGYNLTLLCVSRRGRKVLISWWPSQWNLVVQAISGVWFHCMMDCWGTWQSAADFYFLSYMCTRANTHFPMVLDFAWNLTWNFTVFWYWTLFAVVLAGLTWPKAENLVERLIVYSTQYTIFPFPSIKVYLFLICNLSA